MYYYSKHNCTTIQYFLSGKAINQFVVCTIAEMPMITPDPWNWIKQ